MLYAVARGRGYFILFYFFFSLSFILFVMFVVTSRAQKKTRGRGRRREMPKLPGPRRRCSADKNKFRVTRSLPRRGRRPSSRRRRPFAIACSKTRPRVRFFYERPRPLPARPSPISLKPETSCKNGCRRRLILCTVSQCTRRIRVTTSQTGVHCFFENGVFCTLGPE